MAATKSRLPHQYQARRVIAVTRRCSLPPEVCTSAARRFVGRDSRFAVGGQTDAAFGEPAHRVEGSTGCIGHLEMQVGPVELPRLPTVAMGWPTVTGAATSMRLSSLWP